jgi:hypothetical protein
MPAPQRRAVHARAIRVEAFVRDDGLWDVEASLADTKARDFVLASGIRRAGDAVHDMRLTVTVDRHFNIVDAHAVSLAVPYPGHCDTFGEVYTKLIGLNLLRGFRRELRARLGGIHGCTHITELAGILPTATIQAFTGELYEANDAGHDREAGPPGPHESKPPQLDSCRALRSDGPAVAKFYPRWYVGAGGAEANIDQEGEESRMGPTGEDSDEDS